MMRTKHTAGEHFKLKFMAGTHLPKGIVINWQNTGPCEVIESKDEDGFTTFLSLTEAEYKVKLAKWKEEHSKQ